MKRGTKPTPSRLKVLRGNPGKRQVPEDVDYPIGWPEMPDWLDDLGRQEWQYMLQNMEAAGVVAKIDRGMLAGCVDAYSRAVRASEKARTDSSYDPAARGNWDLYRKMGALFGLGPAERHRVPKAGAPKSKLEAFMGSKG